jgi:hypothetical protein
MVYDGAGDKRSERERDLERLFIYVACTHLTLPMKKSLLEIELDCINIFHLLLALKRDSREREHERARRLKNPFSNAF